MNERNEISARVIKKRLQKHKCTLASGADFTLAVIGCDQNNSSIKGNMLPSASNEFKCIQATKSSLIKHGSVIYSACSTFV